MTWAIALLALGLALVLLEVLVPSMGVLSLLATAAIVGSLVAAFGEGQATGLGFLAAVAVLVPTAIVTGLWLLPRTPLGRRLVVSGLSFGSRPATDERDLDLVGVEGTVESPLRPAGHARLADRRVDVVSRGESIGVGERVVVLEVRGNRVVVARAPRGTEPSAATSSEPSGKPSSEPSSGPSTEPAP